MSSTTSTTRRVVTWSLAAVALAVLLILAFYPKPVPVDLETVARRPLQVTISHEGKTRVHDRYMVSAPVAGRVLRIALRPGDPVVGGQTVVATFVPAAPALLDVRTHAEATARVKAAEAAVSQARATLAEAEGQQALAATNRARVAQLFESALVSQQDRDQAETTARTTTDAARAARAAVAAAEHQLDAARAALVQATAGPDGDRGTLVLHAPITGVVLQRLHESAAVVPAGEPLVEVGNPADLEVVADYLSADAVKIRPGMVALIDRWGGSDPLRARVTTVEPYGFLKISALGVEEQRVNVIASFDDPRADWQTLGDGYRIEMRVVLWDTEAVLAVPTSALFRRGDAWAVFVVADGRAREREVRIGHRSDTEAEVVGGLEAGDRVIVHPADTVATGTRVTPRGDGGA